MEVFQEQAIESTTQKTQDLEALRWHLNSRQPIIRFTMETEKDNKIVFLESWVTREPYRRLTNSVYRKPTHTNQYLAHDSHHPQ